MAEPILAAVAFPLAVIAAVEAFKRCGAYFSEKVQIYKHAPDIVRDFKNIGVGLYRGIFLIDIEMIKWAYIMNKDESLRAGLETDLQKLKDLLIRADVLLKECFDEDGKVKKRHLLNGEKKFKGCVAELRGWQDVFRGTLSLLEIHYKRAPEINLLDQSRFAIKSPDNQRLRVGGEISGGPHTIIVPSAELMRGEREPQLVSVAIESRTQTETDDSTIKRTTSEIAKCLSIDKTGILTCVGYRETPALQLIFEIPPILTFAKTLWRQLIEDSSQVGMHRGRPNLRERVRLAQKLSMAVLSVHASGLVHKNIRPDTILLFRLIHKSPSVENFVAIADEMVVPFLTHWSSSRVTQAVSLTGNTDEWKEDMYRHPERQGISLDTRYNMGHDIYSLGVCLLEIGLWESVVVQRNDAFHLSTTFIDKAIQLGYVQEHDRDRSDRFINPPLIQKIFLNLAGGSVSLQMGPIFAGVVKSCLSCLEGGLGDVVDFNDRNVIGDKFNRAVVEELITIKV